MFAANAWAQQTTLRIFTGGQQRPDVMRKIADEYKKRNANVKVEIEVGGATSEAQQQYLSTVLSSKDSVLDLVLIDVIRPAQWAAQGWAEPLDDYLGADKAKVMRGTSKAYADANRSGGKLISLPYFADSQFLYYRKDLLEKYKRPVPQTWDDMIDTAKFIMEGEEQPEPAAASKPPARRSRARSARISCRCGVGLEITDAKGKLNLGNAAARYPFQLLGRMKQARACCPRTSPRSRPTASASTCRPATCSSR